MPRERILAVTSDPIAEFFVALGSRGYEPLLRKAAGRARFDVVDGRRIERWLVTIDKGDIEVSRKNAEADCVLRVERAAFARVAAGELNLMAAALRAEVAIQGDPKLLVLLQRLFPRPSGGRPQSQRSGSDSSGSEE
jgi:hypothetical protein